MAKAYPIFYKANLFRTKKSKVYLKIKQTIFFQGGFYVIPRSESGLLLPTLDLSISKFQGFNDRFILPGIEMGYFPFHRIGIRNIPCSQFITLRIHQRHKNGTRLYSFSVVRKAFDPIGQYTLFHGAKRSLTYQIGVFYSLRQAELEPVFSSPSRLFPIRFRNARNFSESKFRPIRSDEKFHFEIKRHRGHSIARIFHLFICFRLLPPHVPDRSLQRQFRSHPDSN